LRPADAFDLALNLFANEAKRQARVAFFPFGKWSLFKDFTKPQLAPPVNLAEHLLRCRKVRGIRQRDAAALMGVSWETLIRWEKGKGPSIRQWPAIIAFLGYVPFPEPATLAERIKAARIARGITISELAAELGCDEKAVSLWEADIRMPGGQHLRALNERLDGLDSKLTATPRGSS